METAVKFINNGQHLYGILHQPDARESDTIILFFHGWGTYRIGPHRLFVDAARKFTEAGFSCLRFDFRGRGESEGKSEEIKLVDMISDADTAIEYVQTKLNFNNIILLGLCSGGEVAVASAMSATAIKGLILWSAPVLGLQADLKTNVTQTTDHAKSYWQKIFNPDTWKKIIRFQVNYKAVLHVLFGHYICKPEKLPLEQERINSFNSFTGKALFIYGSNDPIAAAATSEYQSICKKNTINSSFLSIADANHNFYSLEWKQKLLEHTLSWLNSLKENA